MRSRHAAAAGDGARIARLAWLVSFLATLALVAILSMARSAQALTVAAPGSKGAALLAASPVDFESDAEDESEEEPEEDEECEADEEETCEEGPDDPEAPSECLLRSAEATIFASPAQDRLRLVVRYAAVAPAMVAVDYGLHGSKGSLYLGQSRKRFAKAGVVRETETLSESQMAKVVAAKDFTVQLFPLDAPNFCRHYFDRHLTVRHAAPSGLIWAAPEADFRR
jgi:hypothetical protein